MKYLNTLKEYVISCLCFILRHLTHIKNNTIVFHSTPDFSDNAKALYQYLVANGYSEKYDIYFAVNNIAHCLEKYPDEARFIKFFDKNSKTINLHNLLTIFTAKYLIYTHSAPFPLTAQRGHKEQLRINLWHGSGYKGQTSNNHKYHFDMVLVSGDLYTKPMMHFYNLTSPKTIKPIGFPRFDWLLHPGIAAEKAAMAYTTKKIIIWMPTFRNSKIGILNESDNIKQFPIISTNVQWDELDELCRKLDITLLIKLHQLQKDYDIDFDSMTNIKTLTNTDLEAINVNLNEFLTITDGLITDYSSVAIDYLLVDKPIAFTLEDYDMYNETRGFIFDNPIQYMPGHHVYSFDELKQFFQDIAADIDTHREDRQQFKTIAVSPSTCYCETITRAIGL